MDLTDSLTISICTFNRPKQLKNCLKSIFNQKDTFKIIIIDNDYQKSALSIFKQFSKKISLSYYCQPSKNISKARNLAIQKCTTQFIAFIDDDCQLLPNWSQIIFKLINKTRLTFFQGNAIPLTNNKIISVQQKSYQRWIKQPYSIDTKNLILNLKYIKKHNISFDPNLPIFEDVDFGLQLKKNHLKGKFIKDLIVKHQEISNFKKIIKKNYFRGKIKYVLDKKWHNFDDFKPKIINNLKDIFKRPKNILNIIPNLSFEIGFLVAKLKKCTPKYNTITIVNNIDMSANGERCLEITNFLKKNNYQVEIINSQKIFEKEIWNKTNYLYQPISYFIYRFLKHLYYKFDKKITSSSYVFYLELVIRGKIIKKYLRQKQTKLAIIQYSEDIIVGLKPNTFKVIFDLPTIYSQEIKNPKILKIEKKIFKKNIPICFHWYSILRLADKLKMKPKNSFIMNWGCNLKKKSCKHSFKPKIIHLGKLNADWVNQPLLEKIQINNPVDIYSYEKPDPNMFNNIKILGFLKDLSKLTQYQFGLITISKDKLRKNSFSAKHLTYFNYGLPVFCPEWRKDPLLKSATIYYNENNFKSQFKKYSQPKLWLKKHKAAIKLAQKLDWNKTLVPLINVINKIENEDYN